MNSRLWLVRLSWLLALMPALLFAAARPPVWRHALPDQNWQPPRRYVPGSLVVEPDRASVILQSYSGAGYRVDVDPQGQILSRTLNNEAQLYWYPDLLDHVGSPLLVSLDRGDFGGGPPCRLQRNTAVLDLLWSLEINELRACQNVLQQADGGVVATTFSRVLGLDANGTTRWQRQWSEIGAAAEVRVWQLVETNSGRLLVVGSGTFNGVPRNVVWVLDGLTGQPLALHDRAVGETRTYAVRTLPDHSVEWLAVRNVGENEVGQIASSRWSAGGDPLGSTVLVSNVSVAGAVGHPSGFVVITTAPGSDTTQVRYFDGSQQRWQATLEGRSHLLYGIVEHQGQVAFPRYPDVHRYDSNGIAQTVIHAETSYTGSELRYAADGSLWIKSAQAGHGLDPDITLARYAAGVSEPMFKVPLRVSLQPLEIVNIEATGDGGIQVAGQQFASTPTADNRTLALRDLNSDGTVRTSLDRRWPTYPVREIQPVAGGWVVLSYQQLVGGSDIWSLAALSEDGTILWQRALAGYSELRCDGADRCVVWTTEGLQRINAAGQVLSVQTSFAGSLTLERDSGRLIALERDGSTVSLLDLSVFPAQTLARAPQVTDALYWPLGQRLLSLSAAGLRGYGVDQLLWTRADLDSTTQLSTRQGRLHVLRRTGAGPLTVLGLDPASGQTLRTEALPASITGLVSDSSSANDWQRAEHTVMIDAAGDAELWVCGRDDSERARLLALPPGQSAREFQVAGSIHNIRAVADAVYVVSTQYGDDNTGTYPTEVSRFEVDVFGDGFEDSER